MRAATFRSPSPVRANVATSRIRLEYDKDDSRKKRKKTSKKKKERRKEKERRKKEGRKGNQESAPVPN